MVVDLSKELQVLAQQFEAPDLVRQLDPDPLNMAPVPITAIFIVAASPKSKCDIDLKLIFSS